MTILGPAKIRERLIEKLGLQNELALPRLKKVVINVGTGKVKATPKFVQTVEKSLTIITGQKPAYRLSHKAIAGFKLRQGEKVGLTVTLRGRKMGDFILKLANVVLPRMRDFRGLKISGFDKNGNYNLGLTEQIIFPEISPEMAEISHGMSISIVTTAKEKEPAKELLEAWGLPFERSKNG